MVIMMAAAGTTALITSTAAFGTHLEDQPTIPADQGTVTQTEIPTEEVRLLRSIDAKLGHFGESCCRGTRFFLVVSGILC